MTEQELRAFLFRNWMTEEDYQQVRAAYLKEKK